jgi:hypothetical protein
VDILWVLKIRAQNCQWVKCVENHELSVREVERLVWTAIPKGQQDIMDRVAHDGW